MASVIHFLNVCDGDCSWIQHESGRNTVIDVCNARKKSIFAESISLESMKQTAGNYGQKRYPVNPIDYFKSFGVQDIFRFILTHPDMDHLDGIKDLFSTFEITNFWDTPNNKTMESGNFGNYREEDWKFYQSIRKNQNNPKVLNLLKGSQGEYYNKSENDGNGDGLDILSPTSELMDEVNEKEDYNNCSYIILYTINNRKILFAGDSEKKAWDILMETYSKKLTNIDILIAPHHGRKSGGNEEYLKTLNPKLTLFGNAKSEHLDYNSWINKNLEYITNNQGNCILMEVSDDGKISIYCTNERFAKDYNEKTSYSSNLKAWFLKKI